MPSSSNPSLTFQRAVRVPKRITYLRKRDDQDAGQFRAHWSGPHARIAVRLPGVLAYRQNHVIETWSTGGQHVDGIVELWFIDDDSAAAGYGSDVADQLVVDEQRFLSGLVGTPMIGDPPPDHYTVKVWILLQNAGHTADAEVHEWARELSHIVQARGCAVDERESAGKLLVRQKLNAVMSVPDTAIALRFAGKDDAAMHRDTILDAVSTRFRPSKSDVLLAEEVVII